MNDEMDGGYGSYEDLDEYPDRRRNTMVRTVALIVLLAFGATYAGVNLTSFLRNKEVVPVPGEVDPRGFRFLVLDPATRIPVRYDPCSPIHYVVNPANAPRGGLKDVHEAIRLTSEATQIEFLFDGLVDEPLEVHERDPIQVARYGRRWAPVLIGWIPFDSSIFEVDDVGVAGSHIQTNAEDRLVYVTGRIIMNGADQLANGFRPGKTWGKVVLHELGHVLGLAHVADPAQVMNPNLVSSPAAWGTGDLEGLARIGPTSGCLQVPEVP